DLVEAFRRSLANDEDWIAAGDRLAALDRKIEGALAAADGGEEPGGPGGGEEPGDGGGPGGEPGGVPKPEPRAPRAVSETPFRAARSMEELQRLYAEAQSIGRYDLAAQLCTEMIGLAPDRADLYLNRGVMHAFQGQYLPAIEDLDRAEARFRHGIEPQKFLVEIVSQRCQARAFGLQFNEAREDAKRLLEFDPGSAPLVHYLLGIAYKNEGDLDRAIQEYKAALEKGGGRLAVALDVGLCLLEKGDRARALDIFAQTERQFGANPSHARAAAACQAWAWADPAGPPGQDLARARAILDEKVPPELGTPYQYFITAAIYALEGDYPSALAWFRFKWSSWENLPTTGYLYAKAAQALGYEDEARQVLQKAIRMRPALAARYGVAATPEARVLQRAQEEAQEQAKATSATEILDRKAEQEDRVLRVEQIRTLEASYRFAEAAADFKVYARQATSDAARAEASGAAERAAALRGLHERLVARAAKGGLAEVPVRVGENRDARIVGGDERRAELRVGDGRATAPWGFLGLDDFLSLVETLSPKPAEWFALGTFALDQGLEVRAWAALDLARKEKSLRAAVDETIARHRGVPVPPGGFAFHLGQFVSAQEKEKLDSGLVLFRGEWVAPEDRERALKGYQKVRGEWTKLTEADLAARGWEKVGEEWLSPDELASRRGLWASAQERTTEHYALRSDRGAAFLEELGEVLEAAYKEFSTFFGREPSQDRRMVVLAFKDFEGYREYCHKLGRDDVLSALGFAPSEEWTCCGYDKFRDTRSFLQTLVHESTHLYFWVTFGAGTPSWLSEGMATYFEGFRKIGQRYEFHLPSEKRLAALRPVLSGASFELDPLLAGDAAQLINQSMNQALDFYARAWGLFYFLARSDNPAVREIFVEMMERAKAGGAIDLPGLVGDTRRAEFENVLVAFLRGT
ncbi:MAG: tetratricopeptide repeat protein, partial [Planctomycetes bacterium]|nr:tetratricopeptide repeat protein [Planctomycetota bacterium]